MVIQQLPYLRTLKIQIQSLYIVQIMHPKGIEFTWSVWLNLNELPLNGDIDTIFSKGDGIQQNGPSMKLNKETDNSGTIQIKIGFSRWT